MEDKGLGDSIARVTKATGLKQLTDKIPGECGCNKRRERLNKIFPYNKRRS